MDRFNQTNSAGQRSNNAYLFLQSLIAKVQFGPAFKGRFGLQSGSNADQPNAAYRSNAAYLLSSRAALCPLLVLATNATANGLSANNWTYSVQ
jgi:hypothetical protein